MINLLCKKNAALLAAAAICLGSAGSAMGAIFLGSSGDLAASVSFVSENGTLTVTLANNGADVLVPSDVLTAVFFDINGGAGLTPSTATAAGLGDVRGEWAYSAFAGSRVGISSSGLGLFGPSDLFNPEGNLAGPASPDGLQYGITSAVDNPLTGNQAVTGDNTLIKNSVVFTLSGLPSGFELSSIGNVWFQYGTALGEPGFYGTDASLVTPVPETTTLLAGALLLLPFAASTIRSLRRRTKVQAT